MMITLHKMQLLLNLFPQLLPLTVGFKFIYEQKWHTKQTIYEREDLLALLIEHTSNVAQQPYIRFNLLLRYCLISINRNH